MYNTLSNKYITAKRNGEPGPKIVADTPEEAYEYLAILNNPKGDYQIVGEEVTEKFSYFNPSLQEQLTKLNNEQRKN